MKRLPLILLIVMLPVSGHAGDTVKVKVKKSTIYERPQFYSPVVSTVAYGEALEMTDERGDWAFVEFQGKSGWIHKSGLTSDKVNLGTIFFGGGSSSATEDEVTLAGKGFTPQIEGAYREGRPEMNYAMVDMIENYRVDERALQEFIEQGGLRMKEAR
jgi:hypothetical protein